MCLLGHFNPLTILICDLCHLCLFCYLFGNWFDSSTIQPCRHAINTKEADDNTEHNRPESKFEMKTVLLADDNNAKEEENDDIRK